MPYVDVSVDDPAWESIQRIGLTGILRGTGKPQGWANKTFFYPDGSVSSLSSFVISIPSIFRRYRIRAIDFDHYRVPSLF